MLEIKGKRDNYRLESSANGQLTINGEEADFDLVQKTDSEFELIGKDRVHALRLLGHDMSAGSISVVIDGEHFLLELKDEWAQLLDAMGMSRSIERNVNSVTAPMPGKVIDIVVEETQSVKEGEPLLILEAMKMENTISSPRDGVIKSIETKKDDRVEHNQVMILFE